MTLQWHILHESKTNRSNIWSTVIFAIAFEFWSLTNVSVRAHLSYFDCRTFMICSIDFLQAPKWRCCTVPNLDIRNREYQSWYNDIPFNPAFIQRYLEVTTQAAHDFFKVFVEYEKAIAQWLRYDFLVGDWACNGARAGVHGDLGVPSDFQSSLPRNSWPNIVASENGSDRKHAQLSPSLLHN